ncbi:hypothetical protein HanIR_Chr15g0760361 [Helianthus annuus]|nr:hypothetical protein HanIR_Chr15g0760361 [Helianthus annuus]
MDIVKQQLQLQTGMSYKGAEREAIPVDIVTTESTSVTGVMSSSHHGIEVAVEFKPVEHPTEPLDIDQPIPCPLPEPSILNVGCRMLGTLKRDPYAWFMLKTC